MSSAPVLTMVRDMASRHAALVRQIQFARGDEAAIRDALRALDELYAWCDACLPHAPTVEEDFVWDHIDERHAVIKAALMRFLPAGQR